MTQLEFHDKFQTDEQMFIWVNEAEKKIAQLESENENLKAPKLCETCEAKNTCIVIAALKKYGIWKDTDEFGCNYHELKAH